MKNPFRSRGCLVALAVVLFPIVLVSLHIWGRLLLGPPKPGPGLLACGKKEIALLFDNPRKAGKRQFITKSGGGITTSPDPKRHVRVHDYTFYYEWIVRLQDGQYRVPSVTAIRTAMGIVTEPIYKWYRYYCAGRGGTGFGKGTNGYPLRSAPVCDQSDRYYLLVRGVTEPTTLRVLQFNKEIPGHVDLGDIMELPEFSDLSREEQAGIKHAFEIIESDGDFLFGTEDEFLDKLDPNRKTNDDG